MDPELAAVVFSTADCTVRSIMAVAEAAAEYANEYDSDSDWGSGSDGDESSDTGYDADSDDDSAPASPCPQQRTLKRRISKEIERRTKKCRLEREAIEEALCAAISQIGERLNEGFLAVTASVEARKAHLVPIPSEKILAANEKKLADAISLLASIRSKYGQTA
ncbi:hypothetical protein HDU78_006422 [Chytriomyces hyalinus]|nr:hypothetical protein HDU78_006422 [Chytriomyces hyalinus]